MIADTNWKAQDKTIEEYLKICFQASMDPYMFENFKSIPAYKEILEHANKRIGMSYLNKIKEQTPKLLSMKSLDKFLTNDLVGNPQLENFGDFKASSTTLQYIGVLSNLIKLFGDLKGFKILEIGGGYGGQCKIIQDHFYINAYHIIDLKDVMELQKKYLDHFSCRYTLFESTELFDYRFLYPEYDLVISNYALTEIREPLQTNFVKNILLNSKRGYITSNFGLTALDLLEEKFKVTITNDIEHEKEANRIITW